MSDKENLITPDKINKPYGGSPWLWNWLCKVLSYVGERSITLSSKTNLFAKKAITLAIEDDGIHLVIFHGADIEKWSSLPLTPDIIKDGLIVDPDKLGVIVQAFLNKHNLKNKKILFSISGYHSLSRIITLPKLSSSMLYEAISREAVRALPTATDESHIFWHALDQAHSNQKFYILATPKINLEAVTKSLRKGKALGGLGELKPLALARLARARQAVIVDIQSRSADIIIVVEGVPVFFRVLIRDEQTSVLNIASEISRTVEFYNRNNSQQPINTDTPLILTGPLCMSEVDLKAFVAALNHPVESLDELIKSPNGFSSKTYATNIGLALGAMTDYESLPFKWVNINILSASYKPSRRFLKLSMASATAVLGLLSIVPIYEMTNQAAVEKDGVQAKWYRLNQEVVVNRLANKEATRLDLALRDIQIQTEKLEKAQKTIMEQDKRYAVPLAVIHETGTPGLIINAVSISNQLITLEGKAGNAESVVKYVASLEEKGMFSSVRIENIRISNPKTPEISFSLELKEK